MTKLLANWPVVLASVVAGAVLGAGVALYFWPKPEPQTLRPPLGAMLNLNGVCASYKENPIGFRSPEEKREWDDINGTLEFMANVLESLSCVAMPPGSPTETTLAVCAEMDKQEPTVSNFPSVRFITWVLVKRYPGGRECHVEGAEQYEGTGQQGR